MTRSLRKNIIYNAIKTFSSIIYPLITFPYVTRVLLPENVGKVSFAQSFVSYFLLLAMLGIETYAIRECAAVKDNKESLDNVASQIMSINMCASLVSYILLFLTIIIFRRLDEYRNLILIESTTITFAAFGANWLNSAMEDFRYIAIRTLSFQIIALVSMFIFVRQPNDYMRYAFISIVSSSGANVMNIWYRKKYCRMRFTLNIECKKHMMPIFFLFVMRLAQTVFNNTDVTMLGLMKGNFEVGIYSTAHKVAKCVSQVVSSVALVIIPRLSVYFSKNDFENANKLLRKVLIFNISLGLPCVVGVEMIANDIIMAIGGQEYMASVPVLRILMLDLFFSLIGGSFFGNAIMIPMKKERYYMIVFVVTAFLNVIINAMLIPYLSAVGAAIATAFNGLVILLLLLPKIDRRIKIDNISYIFVSPVIGIIGIILCCLFCKVIKQMSIRIITSMITSGLVYAGILITFKNEFALEIISSIKKNVHKKT